MSAGDQSLRWSQGLAASNLKKINQIHVHHLGNTAWRPGWRRSFLWEVVQIHSCSPVLKQLSAWGFRHQAQDQAVEILKLHSIPGWSPKDGSRKENKLKPPCTTRRCGRKGQVNCAPRKFHQASIPLTTFRVSASSALNYPVTVLLILTLFFWKQKLALPDAWVIAKEHYHETLQLQAWLWGKGAKRMKELHNAPTFSRFIKTGHRVL